LGNPAGEAATGEGRGRGRGRLGAQLGRLVAEDVVGAAPATTHGEARRQRPWKRLSWRGRGSTWTTSGLGSSSGVGGRMQRALGVAAVLAGRGSSPCDLQWRTATTLVTGGIARGKRAPALK
jgi:hypothetical protein